MKFKIIVLALFVFLGGCASGGMTGHYGSIKKQILKEDYKAAADEVVKAKKAYGEKNILMYYLDLGMLNHYAQIYDVSKPNFEAAKVKFDDYYTKSISAAALSMVYNDSSMPYYGEDFESIHITVFQALNYILSGSDNEAVVEARQADTLFKANYRKFYKDDGFVRYFMGIVYENGGYLNDAYISYALALKAYSGGISGVSAPKDLINDAYNSALQLGMTEQAESIKAQYPSAQKLTMPAGFGECIIIDYNGLVPQKVENVISIALTRAWAYLDAAQVDDEDMQDFQTVKDVGFSAFSNDYIKVSFPAYKRVPNSIVSFKVEAKGVNSNSYLAQDIAVIAQKTLDSQIAKIYGKTIARVVVKHVLAKIASAKVEESSKGFGQLANIGLNAFNSLSEHADTRAWNTLPENILMSRFYLPEGQNNITVKFLDKNGGQVKTLNLVVDIKKGRKNFVVIKSND